MNAGTAFFTALWALIAPFAAAYMHNSDWRTMLVCMGMIATAILAYEIGEHDGNKKGKSP